MPSPKQPANVVPLRRPDPDAQAQLPLLPLMVESQWPAPTGSADLRLVVRSIDGHDYAVKSIDDALLLPASEFLCYRLASACNLAVPFSNVIDLGDGKLAFGSRFESGVYDASSHSPKQRFTAFSEAANGVSATLAFDLFVGNEDRHFGNFLLRRNRPGQWVATAIDFSRAFLIRGFPNDEFPVKESSRTRDTISWMKKNQLWRGPFAVNAINRLQSVQPNHLQHWFDEMPREWLSAEERVGLACWWQSSDFHDRITQVLRLL